MKIAFVHTPYYFQEYMENLPFVANNFAVLPPMGMMYASSIMKEGGHEADIIDVKAEGLDKGEVIERLGDVSPDMIGLMIIPYTARIALDWAEEIKKEIDKPLVAGNYAMLRYPEAVLSNEFIDYGIVGSSRKALPKLAEYIEGNREDLEDIEGIAYTDEKDEVVINRPEDSTENWNDLPWPDRDSIDNSLYYTMASKRRPMTILITSYGCTYSCDFCDMGDFGYSRRDPEDVVDEAEYCVKEYGIKEFDIFDRDFLIEKERAKEICKKFIERELNVKWSCRTRVDQVDRETLELMKKAGCRLILYGIESGNDEILEREHKDITLNGVRSAIRTTNEVGIETLGFFIIGHPNETEKDIKKTIELSKELPLDYAQFFKMSGKPGAKLYDEITEELGYDYFEKLVRGDEEVHDIPRPWTDLSDEELEHWAFQGYKEFYLRPSYIIKRLGNLSSFSELYKNIRVALKIITKAWMNRPDDR